jgi:phosphate:Na+ symporter
VVSFVNAGLLSLIQASGVIMGANIGTTITAWIISILGFKVKMAVVAVPIIAFGFPMLFSKRDKWRSTGEFLIGFALLFIGLDLLKDSVPDLNSSPELFKSLASLTEYGFLSTILFVLIGALLTIILQSSSAAMALTLVMCNEGWINFESGAAIVLGENIGTTITANLAALIGNVHAKRAAMIHSLFNVIGIIWMLIAFDFVINNISSYLVSQGVPSPMQNKESIPVALSIFHSSFNILNTFILIWFSKNLVALSLRLIQSKGVKDEEFHLEYIGTGLMNTSELSIVEARKELIKFSEVTGRMFGFVLELMDETKLKNSKETLERIKKYEDITDKMEVEIASFLIRVSQNEVSEETSKKIRGILRASSNLEKIGDLCYHMSISLQRKIDEKTDFTEKQNANLYEMFDSLNHAFKIMIKNVANNETSLDLEEAIEIENKINLIRDQIRELHFASIEKGEYNIRSGLYFNNLYSSCEKVGDHLLNISEAVSGLNIE